MGPVPFGYLVPAVVVRAPSAAAQLSVQNLALIEDVQVELEEGFRAWKGGTQAVKRLLLTALDLVLRGKASADSVHAGEKEARAA